MRMGFKIPGCQSITFFMRSFKAKPWFMLCPFCTRYSKLRFINIKYYVFPSHFHSSLPIALQRGQHVYDDIPRMTTVVSVSRSRIFVCFKQIQDFSQVFVTFWCKLLGVVVMERQTRGAFNRNQTTSLHTCRQFLCLRLTSI